MFCFIQASHGLCGILGSDVFRNKRDFCLNPNHPSAKEIESECLDNLTQEYVGAEASHSHPETRVLSIKARRIPVNSTGL